MGSFQEYPPQLESSLKSFLQKVEIHLPQWVDGSSPFYRRVVQVLNPHTAVWGSFKSTHSFRQFLVRVSRVTCDFVDRLLCRESDPN